MELTAITNCTVVNTWKVNGNAFMEFTAQPPGGGNPIAFVVQTPLNDSQGNALPVATVQANLKTAAQASYQAQFTSVPSPGPNPGNFSF